MIIVSADFKLLVITQVAKFSLALMHLKWMETAQAGSLELADEKISLTAKVLKLLF